MKENLIMTDEISEFKKMMFSNYAVYEINFDKDFNITSSKQFKNHPEFVRISKVKFAWSVWLENSRIKKAQYNKLLDVCQGVGGAA